MRLHSWTSDHHMEQAAARSRTSPSSTLGVSDMPENSPSLIWHAVWEATKRGLTAVTGNTCVARAIRLYSSATLVKRRYGLVFRRE